MIYIERTTMQNIDYSRKLKTPNSFVSQPSIKKELGFGNSVMQPFGLNRGFAFFIGSIFLFTGGLMVGLQLGQQETKWKQASLNSQPKEVSFANSAPLESHLESKEPPGTIPKTSLAEDVGVQFPNGLLYPPKMDQINYLIEIGSYDPKESVEVGKNILEEAPELKGRIFRTSTGKLFCGYYYKKEDAQRDLNKIRSLEKDDFTLAEIKTIRF